MPNSVPQQKLARIRTYQDDFNRARNGGRSSNEVSHKLAVETTTPTIPTPFSNPLSTSEKSVSHRIPATAEEHNNKPEPKKTPDAKPLRHVPYPTRVSIQKPSTPSPERSSTVAKKPIQTALTTVAEDLEKISAKKRDSLLTTEDNVFDVTHAHTSPGEGSIVTDTKRNRFRLLPAIGSAIKDWLFEKKEDYEERRKPQYTVAPARTRKDVIERVSKSATLAPKDDYQQVARRLRHVPRTTAVADLAIKKADDVPQPQWTHTETEDATTSNLKTKSASAPETPSIELQESITPVPQPAPHRIQESKPEPAPTLQKEMPVAQPENKSEPHPEPLSGLTPEQPSGLLQKAEPAVLQQAVPQQSSAPYVQSLERPPRSPYVLIGAVVTAIVLGISASFWFFGTTQDATVLPNNTQVSSMVTSTTALPFMLGATHDQFMTNIYDTSVRAGASGITQLYPTVRSDSERERIATVNEVVATFAPHAPGSFTRAITDIEFGVYQGREPFIIMKVTSFDVALGGMLAWESSLSADVAPLFGAPVLSTFDPTARTASQNREPFFVDVVHANRDMRILRDESQDERVVYSFLNRNTILISTDRTVIEEIAPLVH